MSFGFPGPLQASFELENDLPTPKFTPDAATLTLHALSWPKKSKTSKCLFDLFQHFQKQIPAQHNVEGLLFFRP